MKRSLTRGHQILSWVVLALIVIQFFTAGLLVFPGILNDNMEGYYLFHAVPGGLVILGSLLMLLVGLGARLAGRSLGPTALLFVLAVAQLFLAHAQPRIIGALHPANALALLYLAHELARGRFRAALPETAGLASIRGAD